MYLVEGTLQVLYLTSLVTQVINCYNLPVGVIGQTFLNFQLFLETFRLFLVCSIGRGRFTLILKFMTPGGPLWELFRLQVRTILLKHKIAVTQTVKFHGPLVLILAIASCWASHQFKT